MLIKISILFFILPLIKFKCCLPLENNVSLKENASNDGSSEPTLLLNEINNKEAVQQMVISIDKGNSEKMLMENVKTDLMGDKMQPKDLKVLKGDEDQGQWVDDTKLDQAKMLEDGQWKEDIKELNDQNEEGGQWKDDTNEYKWHDDTGEYKWNDDTDQYKWIDDTKMNEMENEQTM